MPATGARGRRQFPDGFNLRAQEELMRDATPVTTRPFLPSSSPLRRSNSATRRGHKQRRPLGKAPHPNANYYEVLTDDDDEMVSAFNAIDLESETRKIISREKERMTIRADVLRTFAESIAACARKFDNGYAHAVASDFTRSLLHHWNQFLHTGEAVETNYRPSQPKFPTINKPAARPPPDNRPPRTKTVSFADVTKAGADQAPGDVRIAPTRRQPIAASNYTNRRVLLRLKEGSSFFEKTSFQIRLALNEKLALTTQDIQDIKPTNTGWALVARNEDIQQKIIEQQTEWGPSIDLHTAEKQVAWHTYLIKDFPSELRSYDDSILDFDKTIGEEIVAQTGQTPVQWRRSNKPNIDPTTITLIISFDKPVRGNFRLLGLGTYSFLLTKPKRLLQCQNCWLFHPPVRCTATKTCRICGITDNSHNTEDCRATPRCTNCHGPHAADDERCYARPRKTGETFHKLSKSQKIHARHLGTNDYRRQNMENFVPSSSSPPAQENEPTTINNNTEADTEMADTPSHDRTPEQAEDPLPAAGDEDVDDAMGGVVEEPPHANSGASNEASGAEGLREMAGRTEQPRAQGEANKEDEVVGVDGGERIREDETTDDEEDDTAKDMNETEEEAEEEGNNDGADREDDATIADEMGSNLHARPEMVPTDGSNQEDDHIGISCNDHIDQQHPQPHSSGRTTTTRVQTATQRNNTTRGRTAQPMTAVKKRFLTYSARRKVIPSDDPNPSSDGPTAEQIIARPLQRRSPPSSPPQEARRRDESPAKRRMTTRSSDE